MFIKKILAIILFLAVGLVATAQVFDQQQVIFPVEQGWLHADGSPFNFLTASTSPTVNYLTATSTSATSTLPFLESTGFKVTSFLHFLGPLVADWDAGEFIIDAFRFGVSDSDNNHSLRFRTASNLSNDRTLTFNTGDANRVVTVGGNANINQNVSTTGSPTFAGATLSGLASVPLYVNGSGVVGSGGTGTLNNCVKWGANNTFADAGDVCGTGGGGGSGTVATSTSETATNVAYWSSTAATPATLASDNEFTYNDSADTLTLDGTSTTTNFYASNTVQLQGVPFSLPPCAKNDAVLFNGTSLVCDAQGTNFTFSIATFSDGEATTQEIGSGTFQAQSTMAFTASYNNGPPTTATLAVSTNGGAYSNIGSMTPSTYTSGTNSTAAVSYPSSKDQTLQFRLSADDGVDSEVQTDTAITFRNYRRTGCGTKASGYTEADIEAISGTLTNTINVSQTVNCGVGQYIVHAYPASYTNMDEGTDYETDGPVDFKFNSLALATIVDTRTLSITTSAGFTENYEVYVSTLSNLGSATFVANTADQTIDRLYYGVTTKTDTYLESDVEGLANNSITNDNTQVWSSVTAGAGEYLLFAFPKRLGLVTFWIGGFEGGFGSPETVSVTNTNGFSEDYYSWRSTNSGLGATVVETRVP